MKSNTAYYTFVSLDGEGNPQAVPQVIPETPEEKERYEGALRRRQLRLILAGRMKPEEATELKNLFLRDVVG
jgi:acyl-CoA hydrolase